MRKGWDKYKDSKVILAFGSNLGDRVENIELAIEKLQEAGFNVHLQSSYYVSEPEGGVTGPNYINKVINGRFVGSPRELLNITQSIERQLGRKNKGDNSPRTIDIDIIIFNNVIINEPDLKIPHPRYYKRPFVLLPLKEIEPDFRCHVKDISIDDLISLINTSLPS
ncbi:MAG: 2-amino-4-hydroxy-6-hydroxymethyldihydropteridine diphosphokinase [Acidobacteria bacterium]|nr:2-amino-4-hydroxy-6-hydroxymethyldihydropteridine diphosphokinase [Acidobacteriota bacterium]